MRIFKFAMPIVALAMPFIVFGQTASKKKIVEGDIDMGKNAISHYEMKQKECLRAEAALFIPLDATKNPPKEEKTYKVSFFSEKKTKKNDISDLEISFNPEEMLYTVTHRKQNTVTEIDGQYFFSPMSMKDGMNFTYALQITDEGIYIKNTENEMLCTEVLLQVSNATVGVATNSTTTPKMLRVSPNPAIAQLSVNYTLGQEDIVQGSVVDLYGRVLQTFTQNEAQSAGVHEQIIDISQLIDGLYYVVLKKQHDLKAEQIGFLVQH